MQSRFTHLLDEQQEPVTETLNGDVLHHAFTFLTARELTKISSTSHEVNRLHNEFLVFWFNQQGEEDKRKTVHMTGDQKLSFIKLFHQKKALDISIARRTHDLTRAKERVTLHDENPEESMITICVQFTLMISANILITIEAYHHMREKNLTVGLLLSFCCLLSSFASFKISRQILRLRHVATLQQEINMTERARDNSIQELEAMTERARDNSSQELEAITERARDNSIQEGETISQSRITISVMR